MFGVFGFLGSVVAGVILFPLFLFINKTIGFDIHGVEAFGVLFIIIASFFTAKLFLAFLSLFQSDVTINVKEPKKYKRRRTIVHGKDMIEEEIEYTDDDEGVDLSDYPEGCAL